MNVGILKETAPGESRVALVPADLDALKKAGCTVMFERGAGIEAGFPDEAYAQKGAVTAERNEILSQTDILLLVRGSNGDEGMRIAETIREGSTVIGLLDPWEPHIAFTGFSIKKCTLYALELLPRITRAQSMDVLSSQANLAGYKAVLLAAGLLPRIFPMMMTAAGTLVPAKVFVVGAGVAGLQAVATAKRLGGIVSAYDVRDAAAEQVESLGAKFIRMELPAENAESSGGYARAMDETFYKRQRELMTETVARSDVVITTAAIPGKPAPVLITEEMIKGMQPGSVVIDLAAERGGNCELSQAGATIVRHGVTIAAPLSLSSTLPYHASQLYSRNISSFLIAMLSEARLDAETGDEIRTATCIMRQGVMLSELIKPRI